jgi:hypothetical protein
MTIGVMNFSSDYILVITPSELDTIRSALRAESDRCKRQGFEGLKTHTDNLRDKISNMMIEQAYTRLEGKSKVLIECEICGDKHALLCEFVDDTIYDDEDNDNT